MKRIFTTGMLIGGLAGTLGWRAFQPLRLEKLPPAKPARNFDEVLRQVAALNLSEAADINPCCRTQVLHHGQATPRAIAFLHGMTNCPQQFHQLAPHFYKLGYNVLLARLPQHGYQDRMSPLQHRYSATDLAICANRTVDLLCGLGEEITLFGFSLGGVMAAWAGQWRSELDRVVLLAPALAIPAVARRWRQPLAAAMYWLPNRYEWWDPIAKEADPPLHAYPRWSSHGVSAMLNLAGLAEAALQSRPPAARRWQVITNPCDLAVDNGGAEQFAAQLQRQGAEVTTQQFPVDWRLRHDLMDPDQRDQQIDRVYPQLIEWMEKPVKF